MISESVIFGDMVLGRESVSAPDLVVGQPYIFIFKVTPESAAFDFIKISRQATEPEQKELYHRYKDQASVFFIEVGYNDGSILQISNPFIENSVRTYEIEGKRITLRAAEGRAH